LGVCVIVLKKEKEKEQQQQQQQQQTKHPKKAAVRNRSPQRDRLGVGVSSVWHERW
jgi:hypothetical protein